MTNTSIRANNLQQVHLDKFWEIFAADGSKAVKIWDSKKTANGSNEGRSHRLYVKLARLNTKEINRLASRISEIDAYSDSHLCVLR